MKKVFQSINRQLSLVTAILFLLAGCSPVNSNFNSHFDENGYALKDSTYSDFHIQKPSKLKFYVEVSGSMNGFFRANKATQFKTDLWSILNYYSPIIPEIGVLTNDGTQGASYQHATFQTMMNTGSFVSTASTKVPLMLQTIINNLNADAGEVAVLVSDMKYSPVGATAPAVLMAQYSTDISKILGHFGKAASLVCATSNYLDNKGDSICLRSPYYYLILGRPECVAEIRNGISTLLEIQGHFIDNIETGFDFGKPKYTFGIPNMCEQLEEEPTFINYEEASDGDTCTVKLKVKLEDYRWIMAKEECFRTAFKATPQYGSEIKVGNIKMEAQNITEDDKQLNRKVTATIDLKIFNMATDSEVIEWSLELPDTNCSLFTEFFDNAEMENNPAKSYSLMDFVKGMFYGGVVNKALSPNYILVSKNN